MWIEREKATTCKPWTATALGQEQQVIWKFSRSSCLIPSDCTTSVTFHVFEECKLNFKEADVNGCWLPQMKSSKTWSPRTKGCSMASSQTIWSEFLHSWHFHIDKFETHLTNTLKYTNGRLFYYNLQKCQCHCLPIRSNVDNYEWASLFSWRLAVGSLLAIIGKQVWML